MAHQVSPVAALLAVRDVAHEQHSNGVQTTFGRQHDEATCWRRLCGDVQARTRAVEREQRQHFGVERQTQELAADVLGGPHPLAGRHVRAHVRPLFQQRVVVAGHRHFHVNHPSVRFVHQVAERRLRLRQLSRHQPAMLRAHRRPSSLPLVSIPVVVTISPVSVIADNVQRSGGDHQ